MTRTHALQLIGGRLTATFTETADAVLIGITGAKPYAFEGRKVATWLAPLLDAYRDDPRRFEISGEHARWTAHLEQCSGGWVAFHMPTDSEAKQ